ncbi:hypothetical protein KOW79_010249 [Hemibagrus wyckioides]|uniref:Uncharacterized protein n=1 Tax=Hemibagrus wyckioides TaxID=337641 RepID=A0A9D3NT53_9TELE|nr:hypothetical protein KOW79_010249 [Hemibagrus wyckioides]
MVPRRIPRYKIKLVIDQSKHAMPKLIHLEIHTRIILILLEPFNSYKITICVCINLSLWRARLGKAHEAATPSDAQVSSGDGMAEQGAKLSSEGGKKEAKKRKGEKIEMFCLWNPVTSQFYFTQADPE